MNKPWKTLIAEDEKLARDRLKRLLEKHSDSFKIIGEARNGDELYTLIDSLKPDLLFLDIEMPGKNIFDVLNETFCKPHVIFCTAYDKYALKAFDTYSLDYLLKPVENERILLTIRKVEKLGGKSSDMDLEKVLSNFRDAFIKPKTPTSIAHKIGQKIILIKLKDIVYFNAHEKYVNFYNADGETYLTDMTLNALEKKLPENFLRISKSSIVNKDYIKEMQKYFRGCFVFIMNDKTNTKIISGRNYNALVRLKTEL